ncbi:F-box only protein 43 [Halichoeres trimaculatus]|uniref:F-box only protein 43 n=1 Tax=Halichoeres trimaculatus TaxID=147232 RepID=UPI003D9E753E
MECTPESNVFLERCKGQHCHDECSDSGYSGLFHSPRSASAVDPCRSLSPVEFSETPKENLRLSHSPREPVRCSGMDSKGTQALPRHSAVSWCETPKREPLLRHKTLSRRPTADAKHDISRTPCSRRTGRCEHWFSASFDSLESVTGALASSSLEQDLQLCSRKRRLLFTQARTSTREDGKPNSALLPGFDRGVLFSNADFTRNISASGRKNIESPQLEKFLSSSNVTSHSPLSRDVNNLNDSSSIMHTPSSSQRPRYIRSVCEDSGFGSLTLDKSQDSSIDHESSFQELLPSSSRGNSETPNLTDTKRRSRLQRQHRLSTLKEGGSQSEDDTTKRKHESPYLCHARAEGDEVFVYDATPPTAVSVKHNKTLTCDGLASAKHDYATPLRASITKPENKTPFSAGPASQDATPLTTTTPVNISLTPALQLVHAMCQQNALMFVGQSPSLKEQLKSTAALAETLSTFRTTMPLAGLIGRKMGLGKIDILTELRKRNLGHILAIILSHLSPKSIHRCGLVSKSWSEIIQQDEQASLKRRNHLSRAEAANELGGTVHVPDAETRLALVKRSALKMVQAQSKTSSFCTPQSGYSTLTPLRQNILSSGSSSKREKFLEIAKTLFNDECLKPCPQCQHPARCHSVKGEGVCSRSDCGFQFCTACLYAFHGSKECGSQSMGRRKKDILLPGSAQSKRNVRRL